MDVQQFESWLENRSQLFSLKNHFEKPLIMGILNITPNSFSDGGRFLSKDRACEQAFHLISHGADLIDIGGESTRPGSEPVSVAEELNRVIPVIEYLRIHSDICISIDTNKPEVMQAAVAAGANVINDVYALRAAGAVEMAAQLNVPVCLMHMQGDPKTMQQNPQYPEGILTEIMNFLSARVDVCLQAGINRKKLILDPGFGFGKFAQDNLYLINKLDYFASLKLPLLLGVSRKSTIGAVLGKEVGSRLIGGIALAVYAALKGVGIIRTHDVDETYQALHMIERVSRVSQEYVLEPQ